MDVAPPNGATATGPSAVEPIGETPFFNALGRATETTVRARASVWPKKLTIAEYHVCVVPVHSGTIASISAAAGAAALPASTRRRRPPPPTVGTEATYGCREELVGGWPPVSVHVCTPMGTRRACV